jgi:hypothetical protein
LHQTEMRGDQVSKPNNIRFPMGFQFRVVP